MKYNLATNSQVISNTIIGDISLTNDELIRAITTLSGAASVPSSGTLVLDCDLGARVHLDDIIYTFDSSTARSVVASGIQFFYKNESFESYTQLNTHYDNDSYYTSLSGLDAARYIRVAQDLTTIVSGVVNGLQVLNDDVYVDFGTDGNDIDYNLNLSVENNIIDVSELYVYNSGTTKANAKLIIEPQNTVADDVLSISESSGGPWYGVYREEDIIAGPALWDTGTFDNTQELSTNLVLKSGFTEGNFITRIINLDEYQYLTFNVIDTMYPTLSGSQKSIIATDDIDTLENIEIRSSNSRPMDRETYIYLTGVANSTLYTNHYWIADGSFAEQSPDWGYWGSTTSYWECWYDSMREDEYWVDKPVKTPTSGSYLRIVLRIRRSNGTVLSKNIFSGWYYAMTVNYSTYKLTFDQSGGFWIYYFLEGYGYEPQTVAAQYRLDHYNSSMSLIYRKTVLAPLPTFIYDMDAVYGSSGDLWYTSRETSTVYKIDGTGAVIASYIAVEQVSGIIALNDGGCWFIQQTALLRLDSTGTLIDSLELPTGTISYIYSDRYGGFWAQDGETIRHLNSDCTEDFNVTIPNLYWITVIDSGVITKQHDGSTGTRPTASYVNKYYKGILRTWDYPRTEGGYRGTWDYNRFGARSQPYDDLVEDHASNFPIPIDSDWNTFTSWTKVSLRDYTFNSEQYHQLRITLRADTSDNSPVVYGVYTQRAIEINNIYPNTYGTFYLKSDVSDINTQDTGDYTSKIRAYWFLDTE